MPVELVVHFYSVLNVDFSVCEPDFYKNKFGLGGLVNG